MRRIAISKLTTKFQATVPLAVREILQLHAKDQIAYEIQDDNTITLRRATPLDIEYLNALGSTLTEWDSQEDEEAYKLL